MEVAGWHVMPQSLYQPSALCLALDGDFLQSSHVQWDIPAAFELMTGSPLSICALADFKQSDPLLPSFNGQFRELFIEVK